MKKLLIVIALFCAQQASANESAFNLRLACVTTVTAVLVASQAQGGEPLADDEKQQHIEDCVSALEAKAGKPRPERVVEED